MTTAHVDTTSASAEAGAMTSPLATPFTPASVRPGAALQPPVDVIEDAAGITLVADLPGVARDRLHLKVDGDQLTIEADLRLAVPQGLTAHHAEVQLARYRRSFVLSKELDANAVNAELQQGVLKVRIPKAAHAQPRRITVQVS
jgi:HSP20 family protein